MGIFLLSDLHINHNLNTVYSPRGFSSVKEANESIIRNWNNTVSPEDTVIVVGDFIMGSDMEYVEEVLDRLNGYIIVVIGNHDSDAKLKIYRKSPKVIDVVDIKQITYRGRKFYISHYPTQVSNFDDTPKKAIVNICGHTHSPEKFCENNPYMYNVACDAHNCTPVNLDQIYEEVEAKIAEEAVKAKKKRKRKVRTANVKELYHLKREKTEYYFGRFRGTKVEIIDVVCIGLEGVLDFFNKHLQDATIVSATEAKCPKFDYPDGTTVETTYKAEKVGRIYG